MTTRWTASILGALAAFSSMDGRAEEAGASTVEPPIGRVVVSPAAGAPIAAVEQPTGSAAGVRPDARLRQMRAPADRAAALRPPQTARTLGVLFAPPAPDFTSSPSEPPEQVPRTESDWTP